MNLSIGKVTAFLLLLALLSGCVGAGLGGQKGSAFEGLETVVAGEGQIYIYRPYKMFWLKAYPNVVVNGKLVGELRNGTYVVVNVSPGIHEITLPENGFWGIPDMTTKIDVGDGERIFLRVGAKLDSVMPMHFGSFGVVSMTASAVMTHIKEDLASAEISSLLRSNDLKKQL